MVDAEEGLEVAGSELLPVVVSPLRTFFKKEGMFEFIFSIQASKKGIGM